MIRDKGTVINQEQVFFPSPGVPSSTHKLAPGPHEWRFSFELSPHLPESVEGLQGNYIIYNLTAEIDRGIMSKSLIATKHVRIIRTLNRDIAESVPFPYVCSSCLFQVWNALLTMP